MRLGKGRFERQQPRHGMARAGGVDQALAQHHVAATLAVDDGAAPRRRRQPVKEAAAAGEAAGVELRIAAGQINRVGVGPRRLVTEGREQGNVGAGLAWSNLSLVHWTTLLGRADCAAHVMRIANAFKEPPHPLADRASEAAAWLAPDAEAGTRSAAVWTVGLMGYKPAAGALAALLDHEDGQLPVEAAQALVRLGDPRGTAAISKLCADPRRRWRAIAYVKEMDRADLVPPELRTPLVEAEDSLRQWLEHPNEYGKPPDEVELLDSSRRRWPGKGIVDCWLFRYRYGEEWDVGMAGPVTFALMGDKLADKPIVQIYGAYEAWDQNPKRGGPALQELAQKVLEESQEDPPRS